MFTTVLPSQIDHLQQDKLPALTSHNCEPRCCWTITCHNRSNYQHRLTKSHHQQITHMLQLSSLKNLCNPYKHIKNFQGPPRHPDILASRPQLAQSENKHMPPLHTHSLGFHRRINCILQLYQRYIGTLAHYHLGTVSPSHQETSHHRPQTNTAAHPTQSSTLALVRKLVLIHTAWHILKIW